MLGKCDVCLTGGSERLGERIILGEARHDIRHNIYYDCHINIDFPSLKNGGSMHFKAY